MSNKSQIIKFLFTLFILSLTVININKYLTPTQVLGIQIENVEDDSHFWEVFLKKNPNYLPGLVEIGEFEKVKKINPNFIFDQK